VGARELINKGVQLVNLGDEATASAAAAPAVGWVVCGKKVSK
jgi:hypothetical protein